MCPALRSPAGPNGSREDWLLGILSSLHEGVLVFDPAGLVIEMNPAFVDLFGYTLTDGPIMPPYPWWPTAEEDAAALAAIAERHQKALAGVEGTSEFEYRNRDRRPVWVSCADAAITDKTGALKAVVRSFRDITGQAKARARREAAARLSVDFATADDLATLLSVGQQGFETLFDGGSTTQLDLDQRYLFARHQQISDADLEESARTGLAGTISADATSLRPGILLIPQTSTTGCRVWVQFPRPRRIGPDEMIVADLLAQAFGMAIDKLLTLQESAERQHHLERAIDAHRDIGQAIGILVERHRITPEQAFDRLRRASQDRNLKLRQLATRIVETGSEPDTA